MSRRSSIHRPSLDNFEKVNDKMGGIGGATHTELAMEVDMTASGLDSIEGTPTGKFVWLCAITASIGGSLFGYDTGIISAVLVYLGTDLDHKQPTAAQLEAITTLCSVGAFFGAIIAGVTADKFGRKAGIYAGCVLFTVGAILQAAAYSIAQMCVGRLIVGLGVGSAAMIIPLYIAEIAPTKVRGRMIGLNNMCITGGQVISYGIGAGFAHVPHGWRYMVGLGGVPSIILGCLLMLCPESPRQLVARGKPEEAAVILKKIFHSATQQQVDDKIRLIQLAIESASSVTGGQSRWTLIKKLHTKPHYFRALVCACGLMVISQMSGFNTLMYYSSTLFALVGFSNPTAVGLVVAGTNFAMTFLNAMTVDPWGRRRLLVSTSWGMSVSLLAVAVAFKYIPIDTTTLALTQNTVTTPAIVVLVFIVMFVFFYGVSVGNTAWMSTDFFPMEVRAMGTMWLTCSCWASNIIVSSTFLSMMKGITPIGAFGFYAAICFLGWILIILFYPEVSGLSLEETEEVFKHGFGVKYARQLRKQRKEQGTLIAADPDKIALGH